MIYVDTSVLLASLFSESERPPDTFWDRPDIFSSRLLEYETWVRVHARGQADVHRAFLRALFERMPLREIDESVGWRLREPFPLPVRTLDAIHLATALSARGDEADLTIAAYDKTLRRCARELGFPLFPAEPESLSRPDR